MVIDWRCQVVGYPGEVMTDMDYSIYPEGFYTVRFASKRAMSDVCAYTLMPCQCHSNLSQSTTGWYQAPVFICACQLCVPAECRSAGVTCGLHLRWKNVADLMLQALMRASAVGKPVIVTETGIPDGADSRRELWATKYLKAVRLNFWCERIL